MDRHHRAAMLERRYKIVNIRVLTINGVLGWQMARQNIKEQRFFLPMDAALWYRTQQCFGQGGICLQSFWLVYEKTSLTLKTHFCPKSHSCFSILPNFLHYFTSVRILFVIYWWSLLYAKAINISQDNVMALKLNISCSVGWSFIPFHMFSPKQTILTIKVWNDYQQ